MARKWTNEMIQEEALKYNTKKEFFNGNRKAYDAAWRLGIDEFCKHMDGKRTWNFETLYIEALNYNTLGEFSLKNPSAYRSATNQNLINDITHHMYIIRIKWTNEMLQEEALKYNTRGEFKCNSKAYDVAMKRGILDYICNHMENRFLWTEELLIDEASKYNSRSIFAKKSPYAYSVALKLKIMDILYPNNKHWTTDTISTEALKYDSRSEFKYNNDSAYNAARKLKMLDEVCSHMSHKLIYWNNEMLFQEGLKYNMRCDFALNSESAYKACKERGIFEDVCSHMIDGDKGFNLNKPATKYYIKFTNNINTYYKIGITNRIVSKRLTEMRIDKLYYSIILHEQYFELGKDAYDLEQLQHKQFKEYQYKGEPIMRNGNTELFIIDVLGLDSQPVIKIDGTSNELRSSSSAANTS